LTSDIDWLQPCRVHCKVAEIWADGFRDSTFALSKDQPCTTKKMRKMPYLQQEMNALRQLARCWNNLDIRFIEKELSDDFVYESQWSLIPIEGKEKFLRYLQSKFYAIKTAMKSQMMKVTAELASQPSMKNKPCLVLTQITPEGIRQTSVLIEIRKNKIKRIEVCFIPDPAEARLTGEFPK
jgi:hypothetical protein